MLISETKARIAQGVREHIRMCDGMGGAPAELFDTMQVAFQILAALHPEYNRNATVEGEREFIVQCGFTKEDALLMVKDGEPGGIY